MLGIIHITFNWAIRMYCCCIPVAVLPCISLMMPRRTSSSMVWRQIGTMCGPVDRFDRAQRHSVGCELDLEVEFGAKLGSATNIQVVTERLDALHKLVKRVLLQLQC